MKLSAKKLLSSVQASNSGQAVKLSHSHTEEFILQQCHTHCKYSNIFGTVMW